MAALRRSEANIGVVVSDQDMTEIKQAEQALQEREIKLKSIFRAAPVGIGLVCNRIILEANSMLCQITGYCLDEIIGQNSRLLYPSDEDYNYVGREKYRQIAAKGTGTVETRWQRKNGTIINVLLSSTPLDSCNLDKGVTFTALDITEWKRTEAALRQSEAKYRALHESLRDAFCSVDLSGRILECNQVYQEMLGYSAEELSRLTYLEVTPERWHPIEDKIVQEQILERGYSDVYEKEYQKKNGAIFPIELRTTLIRDDTGQPVSMWAIIRDISARKSEEEALQRSLEEKETLLREVHHRVKNNLAAIGSLLELQRDSIVEPHSLSLFNDLGSRIKSMALVHEMLYRSDHLSRIDFHNYLEALVQYLRGAFDPQGIAQLKVAATGVWMPLDAAIPCGLIVNELVINAFKYAFPDHRRYDVSQCCEITVTVVWENLRYTLTVVDNGVGLPADLDWRTTRTLGLRLVRMLGQHQLQGTLTLDRTAGTRFTLCFGVNPRWDRNVHGQRNDSGSRG